MPVAPVRTWAPLLSGLITGMMLAAVGLLLPGAVAAAPVNVQIEGVEGALAENVRGYLGDPPDVDDERSARAYGRRAVQRATLALQALGHYRAEISRQLVRTGDAWTLRLDIRPGPPVRLRTVDIDITGEGADNAMLERVVAEAPLAPGQPLNHGDYESTRNALRNAAVNQGFFDYELQRHEVRVNPEEGWADVFLTLRTGPRYRLGEVRFSDTPMQQDLLERLVPFEPGTPYELRLVGDLSSNLNESGYFESVRVLPQRDDAENLLIPVSANLTVREKNSVGLGLGYSTDEGPRGRISWDRPRHNSAGHKLFTDLRISGVRQAVTSRYQIPLDEPLNDTVEFSVGYVREDLEDTFSRQLVAGVKRTQVFNDGWRRIQSLRVLDETFEQADQRGRSVLVLPGLAFSRTRSRGGVDPYWGDTQSAALEIAHEDLLSDASLARLTLRSAWLRRLAPRHLVLLRAEAGAVFTDDFERVPPSLRFFAGGDRSVRGFGYQELAPEDEDGELLGGKYLLAAGIEYNFTVVPKWRAALFVDAGNAFSDPSEFEPAVGTGFGVRWVSPVGPVRVDFAFGVSEPDVPFRLHVSVGPPF
jgi:translocation and assembly module TamA